MKLEVSKINVEQIVQKHILGFSSELSLREQMDSILLVSLVLALEEAFEVQCDLEVFSEKNLVSIETLTVYLMELKNSKPS